MYDAEIELVNLRLAEYLPHLREGEGHTGFDLEFHDRAMRDAHSINRQRDPNGVANLQEDDLESAVEDTFLKIWDAAAAKLLDRLTWAYVKGAIRFALTPMLRPAWSEAKKGFAELPEDLCDRDDLMDKWMVDAGLSEDAKQVVRLKILYNITWKEVADTLEVNEHRARTIYNRALEKLRDLLVDTYRL